LSDITLYVDPLDGTREFVEERLQNCQALVGVAVRGRAVAGAVGVPFPSGDLRLDATIVYGLVGAGYGTLGQELARPFIPRDASRPRPYVATGDSLPSIMEAC
jgi:3'-phosphoadenosine 5'-phosphosulfate (PAPS) 3'-phosphatase